MWWRLVAAEQGVRLLKSGVDGRATFLIHPAEQGGLFAEDNTTITAPGVIPLKDSIRVLTVLAAAGVDSAQAQARYLAEDSSRRSSWPRSILCLFLTPRASASQRDLTGGKPPGRPLALKRELRDEAACQAGTGLTQAEAEPRIEQGIEELAAQLEARSEERRLAERDTADKAHRSRRWTLKRSAWRGASRSGRRRPRATRKRARPSGAQSTKNARRCFASKPSTGGRSCSR